MDFIIYFQNVLISGGFDENNYVENGELYNLDTMQWTSQPYLMPKGGNRIDHVCGTVSRSFREP